MSSPPWSAPIGFHCPYLPVRRRTDFQSRSGSRDRNGKWPVEARWERWSAAEGVVKESAHRLGERDVRPGQGSGKAGVGRKAGVGVDLKDPGPAVVVDSEVDPAMAAQSKGLPADRRLRLQPGQEPGVGAGEVEAAWGVVELEGPDCPLGPVANDVRFA